MFAKITGSSLVILTSQTVKKFRCFNVLMFSWYPLTSGRVKYSLTGINNMPSAGADPGFFLGGGALVSCSTSTPINHTSFFFFAEYQLY